ncbi:hypothetical protein, partial [Bacillus mycoides]|uniref:hypothetical protein n=1 Tax=Bacillus mycoides TaxID=1405 RepID=UPI003D651CFC
DTALQFVIANAIPWDPNMARRVWVASESHIASSYVFNEGHGRALARPGGRESRFRNIWEHEVCVFPLFDKSHWSVCLVIGLPAALAVVTGGADGNVKMVRKRCKVMHFDSLSTRPHAIATRYMFDFLATSLVGNGSPALKQRYLLEIAACLPIIPVYPPVQEDLHSCGWHALRVIATLVKDSSFYDAAMRGDMDTGKVVTLVEGTPLHELADDARVCLDNAKIFGNQFGFKVCAPRPFYGKQFTLENAGRGEKNEVKYEEPTFGDAVSTLRCIVSMLQKFANRTPAREESAEENTKTLQQIVDKTTLLTRQVEERERNNNNSMSAQKQVGSKSARKRKLQELLTILEGDNATLSEEESELLQKVYHEGQRRRKK